MTISNELIKTMEKIGKAIEKGAIEDTKQYLNSCDTITTNGLPGVRADRINTNLSKMVASDDVEIKVFSRSSWKGVLVVDNRTKTLFSVCTKNTLDRVSENKTRRSPHYAQTMLNTVNKDEIADVKQMTIADMDPTFSVTFSEEDFEKDFFSIMEGTVYEYEGYRFWIVTYEVEKFVMKSLSAILMDKDFDRVQEISLLEALKPNFGELTAIEPQNKAEKDVRNLLSVKAGISASRSIEPEMRTEVLPKSVEENKEA